MTAAGAGIVVALVALLRPGAPPPRPVTARPAPGEVAPGGSAWDAAIGIDFMAGGLTPAVSGADLPGKAPLAELELAPNVVGGQATGYVIQAVGATGPVAEAGLRAGDVLMTIDGLPLDAVRVRRLADEFGGLDDVEVAYRRGGELREALIVFRPR